jgi:hypothetical protein
MEFTTHLFAIMQILIENRALQWGPTDFLAKIPEIGL